MYWHDFSYFEDRRKLLCLSLPFLSLFFVFQGKKLSAIESIQQICGFYKTVFFSKTKILWNSVRFIFDISKLFIQCNVHSCCEQMTDGVNINLYECASLLAPVCNVCLCVCACVCMCLCLCVCVCVCD